MIHIPYEGPCPAIIPYPEMALKSRICGIFSRRRLISSITLVVSASDEPGASVTFTITVPWSSSGTRPVFVLFISTISRPNASASVDHMSHLCLMKSSTPCLYFLTMTPNAALKALRKRAAKLSRISPFSSRYGFMIRAQSAGDSVRAFTAERPTATAIVIPNCV